MSVDKSTLHFDETLRAQQHLCPRLQRPLCALACPKQQKLFVVRTVLCSNIWELSSRLKCKAGRLLKKSFHQAERWGSRAKQKQKSHNYRAHLTKHWSHRPNRDRLQAHQVDLRRFESWGQNRDRVNNPSGLFNQVVAWMTCRLRRTHCKLRNVCINTTCRTHSHWRMADSIRIARPHVAAKPLTSSIRARQKTMPSTSADVLVELSDRWGSKSPFSHLQFVSSNIVLYSIQRDRHRMLDTLTQNVSGLSELDYQYVVGLLFYFSYPYFAWLIYFLLLRRFSWPWLLISYCPRP